MVLFINSWYKKFLKDLAIYPVNKKILNKYYDSIPKRAKIEVLIPIVKKDNIDRFFTKTSAFYALESQDKNQLLTTDGSFFHEDLSGNGYVFYVVERGSVFNVFLTLDKSLAFTVYVLHIMRSLGHVANNNLWGTYFDEFGMQKK
jgi:hypothetical protein